MKLDLTILIMACVLIVGCATETQTETPVSEPASAAALTADDMAGIEAMTEDLAAAFLAGDKDAAAELFTEDAVLMPSGAPTLVGRQAIRASMDSFPPVTQYDITIDEIEGMGDARALVRGTHDIRFEVPGADEVTMKGKFIALYEKQPDGSWKLTHDIFNEDAPPASD